MKLCIYNNTEKSSYLQNLVNEHTLEVPPVFNGLKKKLNSIVPFLNPTDCAPLMIKQISSSSVNTFLVLKHYKQLLKKWFLFLFFAL